jgi:hypothetical protein
VVKAGSGYPGKPRWLSYAGHGRVNSAIVAGRAPGRRGENGLTSQSDLGDISMRRTVPFLAAAAACALLGPAGASAMTPAKTCTASSPNVIGKTVKGTLTSSNVDPFQARFSTCTQARKVMVKTTELRIEEPRSTKAFYCVPTVRSTEPDVVAYKCTFKGADTATFIKLLFQVKYDQD